MTQLVIAKYGGETGRSNKADAKTLREQLCVNPDSKHATHFSHDEFLQHLDFVKGQIVIRLANTDDASAICAIYNRYVLNTTISFEDAAVRVPAMAERISAVLAAGLPWYVSEEDGAILGYAYATPWRTRHAYRFSVEISIYVSPERKQSGIGSQLYAHLIDELQRRDVHSVIAGISLPNPASVALHEKFGMTQVAHFKEVGFKFGRWIDVGYWEKQI